MASSGVSGGPAAAVASQRYFCHQCNGTVTLAPSPTSDLACPICHGGFVEELETPAPDPNPTPFLPFPDMFSSPTGLPFPFFFSASSSVAPPPAAASPFLNVEDVLGALAGTGRRPRSVDDLDAFNPTFQFLQSRIQDLVAGGANIQFVIENHPSGEFHLPRGGAVSFGDYFFGPGLEQLIQQLAENDPNRYGTPPASKSAVEALPEIKITEELLASDEAQCAVCKDTFEVKAEVKQMPCKHIYHKECIIPWLELHNSCPVCRYELPTDDQDYEQRRGNSPPQANLSAGTDENGSSRADSEPGSAVGEGNSPGAWAGERIMRISLPWTIRSLFGLGNSSRADGSGDTNSGAEGTNSGTRGGQNSGSETRQEDLD